MFVHICNYHCNSYELKHELFTERLNDVQNINNSQNPTTEASVFDRVPKYPMTVHAENV